MVFFTQWSASCKTQNNVNPLSGPQFQRHGLASVYFIHLDRRMKTVLKTAMTYFNVYVTVGSEGSLGALLSITT